VWDAILVQCVAGARDASWALILQCIICRDHTKACEAVCFYLNCCMPSKVAQSFSRPVLQVATRLVAIIALRSTGPLNFLGSTQEEQIGLHW